MAKPTISKQMIRRKIRQVLLIASGYGKTEAVLHEAVNDLVGGGVSLQELRDGIEWNHAEALIRSQYDGEAEETQWFITPVGKAKENIK